MSPYTCLYSLDKSFISSTFKHINAYKHVDKIYLKFLGN